MKKSELQALLKESGLTDEKVIDAIVDATLALYGKSTTALQTQVTDLTTERNALQGQVKTASDQIAAFKGMKPEDIDRAAKEWEAKVKTAQEEAARQVAKLKLDHALEAALTKAGARSTKAVSALLKLDDIKLNEEGALVGLDEQLAAVRKDNDFMFQPAEDETLDSSGKPKPRIVGHGVNKSVLPDPLMSAMLKGAGIPEDK